MNGQAGYETGSQMAGFKDSCNNLSKKGSKLMEAIALETDKNGTILSKMTGGINKRICGICYRNREMVRGGVRDENHS